MAELNNQAVEVALAMLERDGCWLMQLRDDIPGIVAPGCWGLFGGHLDPGETAEQALQRELCWKKSVGRRSCSTTPWSTATPGAGHMSFAAS